MDPKMRQAGEDYLIPPVSKVILGVEVSEGEVTNEVCVIQNGLKGGFLLVGAFSTCGSQRNVCPEQRNQDRVSGA